MDFMRFLPYLLVMAGVTYLIRAVPFTIINKKIENRFINSFLYYCELCKRVPLNRICG